MDTVTTLYLIRHAEVEASYQGVFGGRIDMDISPRGHEQAATLGRRYLELKSDDAQSLALVAWYAANLDRASEARALLGKAESLGTERGEVALLGAQTMARLGDPAAARRHIDFARKHGIPQQRIEALPLLRSLTATVEPSSEREPGAAR